MQIFFLLFTFIVTSSTFACDEVMKSFKLECTTQDNYHNLVDEFNKFSVSVNDLKGFKIPKAIGESSYSIAKTDLLNHTRLVLTQNGQWNTWLTGQNFIKTISPLYIEANDILNLYDVLFPNNNFSINELTFGRLRSSSGLPDPTITFSCADKTLSINLYNLLYQYDLKNSEGYPLLQITNTHYCDSKNYKSATLYFLKNASVPLELNRWILDFNDMLSRYENNNSDNLLAPYDYLADMRRWFLALRPFNIGNEEVVNALIDYATNRLNLPPFPGYNSNLAMFLSVEENREESKKRMQESLSFFQECLYETKIKLISPECSAI